LENEQERTSYLAVVLWTMLSVYPYLRHASTFSRGWECRRSKWAFDIFPQRGTTHSTRVAGCLGSNYNSPPGVSFC